MTVQQIVSGPGLVPDIEGLPFRDLLQALPVAVYTTDAAGKITFFNEAAAELWGRRPSLGISEWCGSWKLLHPDGRPMAHDECPMAIALREKREVRWSEAIAERPDGTRIPFLAHPTPLFDKEGKMVGAVNTLVDLTGQRRGDEAGMRLSAIVDSSMDAIISKDLNGIITSWNHAAEMLFGYSPAEAIGRSVLMLIPEWHKDEEASIISRIRRGERVETYETIRRRKDGSLVPVSLTVSPVRDPAGRIVGASKIVRDITSKRDSEQRIRLLMREVNHRVKNQYAVILSMIRETNKRSKDPADFERRVRERIMALSQSHDLLVDAEWKGATLRDLVRAQVLPFGNEECLSMSGPQIVLQPNAVQYLGIAFHELATNSAKFGVLGGGDGSIAVDWHIDDTPEGWRFRLSWRESGGDVEIPTASGFGSVVLKRVAPLALGGTGALEHLDNGVFWALDASLSAVEASLEGIERR
ncbi:MAG: PAS domain S-box protein [Mesorhizobium sp.]|nr:PAS domain S-box protein [Mesorhizobium sp.]